MGRIDPLEELFEHMAFQSMTSFAFIFIIVPHRGTHRGTHHLWKNVTELARMAASVHTFGRLKDLRHAWPDLLAATKDILHLVASFRTHTLGVAQVRGETKYFNRKLLAAQDGHDSRTYLQYTWSSVSLQLQSRSRSMFKTCSFFVGTSA